MQVSIETIVAARNEEPYVQMHIDGKMVLQMNMSTARKVANDIILAASRAEADAMLIRFFKDRELPMGAAAALMTDFRDFRLGLDLDKPEGSFGTPSGG